MHAARTRSASRRRSIIAEFAMPASGRRVSAAPAGRQRTPRQRFVFHRAGALSDDDDLVGVDAGDRVRGAAGPSHLESIDVGPRSEAEVDAQIVLRAEAAAA